MLRAMFRCVVKCYWELLIGARVVSWSWRQLDILGSYFLVCAEVNVVEPTLLCRHIVLFVVVRAWNRFCFLRLFCPQLELRPFRLAETWGSFLGRL